MIPELPLQYGTQEGMGQASSGDFQSPSQDSDVLALHAEVQRLRAELAEAQMRLKRVSTQGEWSGVDFDMDYGSEVYCTSFASTAWSTNHFCFGDGVRLFINQNNTLTELIAEYATIPNPSTKLQWDRRFVSPVPLMSNSAIAAVNSMVSRDLIHDPDTVNDRGRNVMRVFYFDIEGTLREWIWQDPVLWRRSALAIRNVDPRSISAVCWAEDGFAEWSLFYVTKEEFVNGCWRGGRLMEQRCTGGSSGRWRRAVDVGWSRMQEKVKENHDEVPRPETLQSGFSVTTNQDGTDRRIFYLDKPNTQGNSKFMALKWGGNSLNKWVSHPEPARSIPSIHMGFTTPGLSAMHLPGTEGLRIYFQDGEGIGEWVSEDGSNEKGRWTKFQLGSNNTSQNAVVATAFSHKRDHHQRRYVFSLFEGRIVQTTYFPELNCQWSAKPITIRKIQA